MKVTLVFDIGKTNKKCILFNEKYQEVFREYRQFEEITDDDGDPCDDLHEIQEWVESTFKALLQNKDFEITAVNFSTYGASLVHIDKSGQPVCPLYNYLKPYPASILKKFHATYGDKLKIAKETASPSSEMLNSGLQLYWLKYAKPEVFNKIHRSLHFPQYLCYVLTGESVSDYTSTGCHTGLWHYEKKDYHDWVYSEGIDQLIPPIVDTSKCIHQYVEGGVIRFGVGIHDSSAALLPYMLANKNPFLLISTGTWSISLNPFNTEILTEDDLANDCLNYMQISGNPVKASRLFLGNEYHLQVENLQQHFNVDKEYHQHIQFDEDIYHKLTSGRRRFFAFHSLHLTNRQPESTSLESFASYEEAYHQLMIELVELQVASTRRAIGITPIKKIYVDGGFADNDVYLKLLSLHFIDCKVRTTQTPVGSALGAALVTSDKSIKRKILKELYSWSEV